MDGRLEYMHTKGVLFSKEKCFSKHVFGKGAPMVPVLKEYGKEDTLRGMPAGFVAGRLEKGGCEWSHGNRRRVNQKGLSYLVLLSLTSRSF